MPGWAASPAIYANSGPQGAQVTQTCTTKDNITVCFGSVTNPALATDADFKSAAVMNVPVSSLVSSIRLRMDLTGPAPGAPTNYRAGVVVERSGGVLDLAGLTLTNAIIIRTLKKNGTSSTVQEEMPVSAALAGLVLGQNTGPVRLEFIASKPFDQIEIEAASLLSLGYNLKVYYAYAIDANVINNAKGYLSRFDNPSASNYSTAVIKRGITVCVNDRVSNPLNAVDKDLTKYAVMGSLVDLSCPTTLRTQLEGTAPAGYEAGFVVGNGGLLDVSILDGLRITTYLGTTVQDSSNNVNLLNLKLLPGGQYAVHFPTSKPYDRVEIRRTSLLSALDNLRIYYGFGLEPRVFRDETPRLSQFGNAASKYQVSIKKSNPLLALCLLCSVNNPERTADNSLTNFATVQTPLTVGYTIGLKMKLDGPGQAGNTAGVILGTNTNLLDVDLLANIRVNTYTANGTELAESATGSALLKLEVLADGRREVSFRTTQDFDWVEVELMTGVSLLSGTAVYYGFAEDRPTGFPSIVTVPAPLPVQLVGFTAKAHGQTVDLAWQTATELNSDYFVVERSANPSQGFVAVSRVKAAGTTATGRAYTLRDTEAALLPAGVLYYRLRQVDADGTQVYSSVVVVARKDVAASLAVYPNPAATTDIVRLTMSGLPEGQYQLLVYNMQGSLVSQQPLTEQQGRVAVETLRAGMYQVIVQDAAGQQVASQRLVLSGH
ncbi:T9SS type A sorting domain-containing protein [Hymenobacter rubripertinctus]|uniref:T9SS C-terminal target domain-containing protein n=1 Tax=Hymenobacter rubripertinctus TaxID=2029981 RepID=A0A418QXY7_9BACT|nr:T9SS type A sorting domain-containing protein [Hymenobacter rubripertinctus]RIY10025.1 T9SS C-terminal target domain-containing protein [Hymenobacter rubripertinctus]